MARKLSDFDSGTGRNNDKKSKTKKDLINTGTTYLDKDVYRALLLAGVRLFDDDPRFYEPYEVINAVLRAHLIDKS